MLIKKLFSSLTNTLYGFGMLMSAFFITWCLLSRVDFFYPSLHQQLDITATVSEFGPKNRYKDGFETTTPEQHFTYFSNIVAAINNDGKGLDDIYYPYQNSQIKLLRKAEVLHLQDVAFLLNKLSIFSYAMMILLLMILIYRYRNKRKLPSVKKQFIQLIIFISSLTIVSGIVGFKEVFYWFHRVSFPENNEWFFYYQDSLMTTMMQAPTLFAPISVLLVICTCICFVLLNVLIIASYEKLVTNTK